MKLALEYRPRFGLWNNREEAVRMWNNLKNKSETEGWHIGITTNCLGFADFDGCSLKNVIYFSEEVSKTLNCEVGIFKTNRGYHVVAKKKLNPKEWRFFYRFAIKMGADHLQCSLALKKQRATLRISPKNGKQPKLIMIFNQKIKIT